MGGTLVNQVEMLSKVKVSMNHVPYSNQFPVEDMDYMMWNVMKSSTDAFVTLLLNFSDLWDPENKLQ